MLSDSLKLRGKKEQNSYIKSEYLTLSYWRVCQGDGGQWLTDDDHGSVAAAALRQDAAGLSELGCGDVKQSGPWHEGQKWQVLLQLVQPGDGDDAVCV